MLDKYLGALRRACDIGQLSPEMMKAVAARDFAAWVKEERLPKPPIQNR